MIEEMVEQIPISFPDSWFGRMSRTPYPSTTEKTSELSLKRSQKSRTTAPLFLDMRGGGGDLLESFWETDGASLGEFMTAAGSASRKDVAESASLQTSTDTQHRRLFLIVHGEKPLKPIMTKLSDILETNPDPKYNLSPKACQGILNRAARRGKELPEMLRAALERQAKAIPSETTTTDGLSGSSPCASTLQPEETDSRTYSEGIEAETPENLAEQSCLAFKLGNSEKSRSIGCDEEMSPTLNSECGGNKPAVCYNEVQITSPINRSNPKVNDPAPTLNCDSARSICIQGNCIDRADTAGCNGRGWTEDVSYTLNTIDRPAVYDARGNGDGETVPTITGDHQNRITDYTAVCCGSQSPDIAGALDASYYKGCGARNGEERTVVAVDCRNGTENADINGTLQAKDNGGYNTNSNNICREGSTVRRLTVLECERLQQLPDGWTDIGEWVDSKGKKHKEADAPRYKAIGNGIALPFWRWLLKRISDHCEEKTMGSLFDGVGSYPLIWQSINGDGSCRWTSEIEEFPIAVTTKHFGDEEKGIKGDWEQYVHQGTAAKT